MRAQLFRFGAGLLLLAAFADPAEARTITVAKDGTGAFGVIQEAINAAQAGDTISIGPGRFADVRLVVFPLEWAYVAILPTVPNLFIRGAGAESTIVGFVHPTPEMDGHRTGAVVIREGLGGSVFEGIRFEHMEQLVNLLAPASFVACRFRGPSQYAVALGGVDGVRFSRCMFNASGGSDFILGFVGGLNRNLVVEDCSFVGPIGYGINLSGAANLRVDRSTFSTMTVGISTTGAVGGLIRDCRFAAIANIDVSITGGEVVIDRCDLGSTNLQALDVGGSRIVGAANRIRGGGLATVYTSGNVEMSLTDGEILNGGGWSVQVRSPASYRSTLELKGNYWGTTDPDQIAAWIRDGNDPPLPGCAYCPASFVEYSPILDGSVPNAETSFGGLKARHGDARKR